MARRHICTFLLALILVFTTSADAAVTVPVVIKVLPGSNIPLIAALLGGTVIDSIPDSNTYLLRLPSLPILTPTLKLLGVDWVETDRGVSLPSNPRLALLGVPLGTTSDWYKNQPGLQLIHSNDAQKYSTGRGVMI